MADEISESAPAPAIVLYLTDLTYDRYDPADLFDLAFLLRSPDHALAGVCLASDDPADGADRVLESLTERAGRSDPPRFRGAAGLAEALTAATEPVSLVVVGGYGAAASVLESDPALFRAKVARLFLVGGFVNDYTLGAAAERLPIDPRLMERNPERFAAAGDPRLGSPEERAAWARLLVSGEGVVWLPRDICLWRYAAPGILEDGGPLCDFLLRELYTANLAAPGGGPGADRYFAAEEPALLSALPALLLAARPDPFAWMRLFRAVTAKAETENGVLTSVDTQADAPNLYAVVAIDGQALGKLLTARLRDRPLRSPN